MNTTVEKASHTPEAWARLIEENDRLCLLNSEMLAALMESVAHMIQEYNSAGGDEEAKVNPNLARLSQIIERAEVVISKAKGDLG